MGLPGSLTFDSNEGSILRGGCQLMLCGFHTNPAAGILVPSGAMAMLLDELDSPFSFTTNSANLSPYSISGSVRWSRCVDGQIIHTGAWMIHDYWIAQKVQNSTAHCSLELKSHMRNRITASREKRGGACDHSHRRHSRKGDNQLTTVGFR